jgi:hypothetical protein
LRNEVLAWIADCIVTGNIAPCRIAIDVVVPELAELSNPESEIAAFVWRVEQRLRGKKLYKVKLSDVTFNQMAVVVRISVLATMTSL